MSKSKGIKKDCTCRYRSDPNTDRPGIVESDPNCPVHHKRSLGMSKTRIRDIADAIKSARPMGDPLKDFINADDDLIYELWDELQRLMDHAE